MNLIKDLQNVQHSSLTKESKATFFSSIISSKLICNKTRKNLRKKLYTNLDNVRDLIEEKHKTNNFSEMYYSIKNYLKEIKTRKEIRNRRKSTVCKQDLINIIAKSASVVTLKEIKSELLKKFPKLNISTSKLRRIMIYDYGIKYYKRALFNIKTMNKKALLQLIVFSEKIIEIMYNKGIIIYLDECSFNETIRKKKMWMSENINNTHTSSPRIKSISVVGAMMKEGIFHYKSSLSTFKSEHFISFIRELECKIISNKKLKKDYINGNFYIILDNAKIHVSKASREELKSFGFNFIYQPAYQPSLNSIEMYWSIMKRKREKITISTV